MPLLRWDKHKQIMVRILKDIYNDSSLGGALGFKGGTAAMLFYGLSRRSVDLDFDVLGTIDEKTLLSKAENIIGRYGTVRERRVKRYTIFLLLSYGKDDANIKIELSRRGAQGRYEARDYLGITLLVMCREDMFANKLIALMNRKQTATRDLYDVWFFAKNQWGINEDLILERTGKDAALYCADAAKFTDRFSSYSILSGLGELLDEKQKSWVKKHLKDEVVFELRLLGDSLPRTSKPTRG